MTKYFSLVILFLWVTGMTFGQNAPEWVKKKPGSSLFYSGVGMALKSEKEYRQKAKQNALNDLASEIKVEISSNSLLNSLEKNGEVTSGFEETIRVKTCENIENFHMTDSWENEREYWVFYELSILDYQEYMEKRKKLATGQGCEYLRTGKEVLEQGNLMSAVELWGKGLEVIQPAIQEELICIQGGESIDVGKELYTSMKTIFNGITIQPSVKELEARAFEPLHTPVRVEVKRNGLPLRNLKLKCSFVSGSGQLSRNTLTDENGQAEFFVEKVTSKSPRQEIHITLDDTPFRQLEGGVYDRLVKDLKHMSPCGVVYVNLGQNTLNAYIQAKGEDQTVLRAVKSVLTDNYFNIVANPEAARVVIRLNTDFRKGEVVRTGISSMVTYYVGAVVKIEERETSEVLLDYSLEDVKVLQSPTVSKTAARNAAIRELVKRLQRQLPEEIKNMDVQ